MRSMKPEELPTMRTTLIVEDESAEIIESIHKTGDQPSTSVIRKALEEYFVDRAPHPGKHRFGFMKLGRSDPEKRKGQTVEEFLASDEYAESIAESSGLAESRRRIAASRNILATGGEEERDARSR
jgi:hypothetical protein